MSEPGTSSPLSAFADDERALDAAAFAAKHGRGFLVLHGTLLQRAYAPEATRAAGALVVDESTGDVAFRVFPLVRRPTSAYPFVTIGRAPDSDVVVVDASVSKFHAYVKEERDAFTLQDAKSRNGTFIGEDRVAARGTGAPVPLASGASIRFGSVVTTFLLVDELRALVRTMSRP